MYSTELCCVYNEKHIIIILIIIIYATSVTDYSEFVKNDEHFRFRSFSLALNSISTLQDKKNTISLRDLQVYHIYLILG